MSARNIIKAFELPVSPKDGKPGTTGSHDKVRDCPRTPHSRTPSGEPVVPTLQTLEAEIERNKGRSLLIGRDLKAIRDQKLYRSTGQTWDNYCESRFRFGKRSADYYISTWLTAQNCGVPDDFSPRSLRPLTGLSPERQKQAWSNAVRTTKTGRPSPKDIRIAVSHLAVKRMTEWKLRSATAINQRYLKIGLKKALAGANEVQTKEYCERLSEFALDWAERHNTIPVPFDPETALERVKRYLAAEFERWPSEHHRIFFERMAQVFRQEEGED